MLADVQVSQERSVSACSTLTFTSVLFGGIGQITSISIASVSLYINLGSRCSPLTSSNSIWGRKLERLNRACEVYLQLPGARQVGAKSIVIFVVRKSGSILHHVLSLWKSSLFFCLSFGPQGKIFCLSKGFFHKQVILFKWVSLTMFINM